MDLPDWGDEKGLTTFIAAHPKEGKRVMEIIALIIREIGGPAKFDDLMQRIEKEPPAVQVALQVMFRIAIGEAVAGKLPIETLARAVGRTVESQFSPDGIQRMHEIVEREGGLSMEETLEQTKQLAVESGTSPEVVENAFGEVMAAIGKQRSLSEEDFDG